MRLARNRCDLDFRLDADAFIPVQLPTVYSSRKSRTEAPEEIILLGVPRDIPVPVGFEYRRLAVNYPRGHYN